MISDLFLVLGPIQIPFLWVLRQWKFGGTQKDAPPSQTPPSLSSRVASPNSPNTILPPPRGGYAGALHVPARGGIMYLEFFTSVGMGGSFAPPLCMFMCDCMCVHVYALYQCVCMYRRMYSIFRDCKILVMRI